MDEEKNKDKNLHINKADDPSVLSGVLRFDQSLVKKLRQDIDAAKDEREEIIRGSRLYWQRVQSVHQSVLQLQDAEDFEAALTLLQDDVARHLGFDALTIVYERLPDDVVLRAASFFKPVSNLISQHGLHGQDVCLVEEADILKTFFPEQSGLLAFALCFPLTTNGRRGLLVMGNREAHYLSYGQALEPYVFLARFLERMARIWLNKLHPKT